MNLLEVAEPEVVGTGMSGGSSTHGTTTDPSNKDACSKMKNKIATEKGREIIKDLEAKAKYRELVKQHIDKIKLEILLCIKVSRIMY